DVVITWRDVVLAVGDQGALLRSSDGGTTWVALDSGTSENLRSISATGACVDQINDPGDLRAVAVGDAGTLLFSENDGASWTKLTVSPPRDLRQIALFHP